MNLSNLKLDLREKSKRERSRLVKKFINELPPTEIEYYMAVYDKVHAALKSHRHVTRAIHFLSMQGIFISESEVSIYYQVGCAAKGLEPITPSEAVQQMNKDSPLYKNRQVKTPPILDRLVSPDIPSKTHYSEED